MSVDRVAAFRRPAHSAWRPPAADPSWAAPRERDRTCALCRAARPRQPQQSVAPRTDRGLCRRGDRRGDRTPLSLSARFTTGLRISSAASAASRTLPGGVAVFSSLCRRPCSCTHARRCTVRQRPSPCVRARARCRRTPWPTATRRSIRTRDTAFESAHGGECGRALRSLRFPRAAQQHAQHRSALTTLQGGSHPTRAAQ